MLTNPTMTKPESTPLLRKAGSSRAVSDPAERQRVAIDRIGPREDARPIGADIGMARGRADARQRRVTVAPEAL